MRTILCLFVALPVLLAGCGRKNPVNEISAAASGLAVTDAEITSSNDWNGWRGPTNNGIVPDMELPTQWDEKTNVRWRTEVPGRGHSSPVVVGDSVYVVTAIDKSQQQSVLAMNRDDGVVRWITAVHEGGFPSPGENHKKGTNANGTLACDGERLFTVMFNSEAIIASALDLEGNLLWQKEVGKFVSRFGYAPSPVLYKSALIVAADNSGGGYLAALDRESGEIVWRVSRGNVNTYSSPVVANVGGQDQLLISGGDRVASYDPVTGEERWSTSCTTESTCGTIVATKDKIFAAGGYPDNQTICLSADGRELWSNNTKVYEPSLLVSGNRLYAFTDRGVGHCWSIDTGEEIWKKRLGGNFSASPIISGDRIYVPNLSGDTFVLRASDRYELISKNRIGNDSYASPAASNGQIFLRIGVPKGAGRSEEVVCIGGQTL